MRRYYTQFGCDPEVKACVTIAGPQAEDQVPEGVRQLLDMPGITEVAVLFDHGLGPRINTFRLIKECMLAKIISGVDRAALDVALELGIPCGGLVKTPDFSAEL